MKLFLKILYVLLKGNNAWARKCGVIFGKNCSLLTTNWGTEPFLITLGDNVTITSGVRILTHDGSLRLIKDNNGNRFYKYQKVIIGNNVFVGINSVIMPGVSIGSNSIVGAHSVVTKSIPPNSIYAGNPARKVSSFDAFQEKAKANFYTIPDLNSKNYKDKILEIVNNHES
ncbi:acyltransferase [Shewanella sp. 10N.286.48.A6]|uniref:acyltransferase n=1 Tax=Shewanella sp. 10N.286.48.A6 TaxID=1880833 RepID=UPI000C8503F0|nr:acyltransferase [Shewanella sp. 10N.286.48.A6]PMI02839.1 hypothetical protein BCU55_04465 [Shewanella sp. 10N.286.48.A6]